MLRRDTAPRVWNKPAGFTRGCPNGYPFDTYPRVFEHCPTRQTGMTVAGIPAGYPCFFIAGCSSSAKREMAGGAKSTICTPGGVQSGLVFTFGLSSLLRRRSTPELGAEKGRNKLIAESLILYDFGAKLKANLRSKIKSAYFA